uniref:Protein tyrosine phosphatase type IVA 2 n=1 Tax=Magallana gigas TaxID=29159 RepID=K1R3S5_MAGGI
MRDPRGPVTVRGKFVTGFVLCSSLLNCWQHTEELKKRRVKDVVRVCEPTYKTEKLVQEGIRVLDWQFDDGNPPPAEVVDEWFNLLKTRFKEEPGCCVAVHCVAGLGR